MKVDILKLWWPVSRNFHAIFMLLPCYVFPCHIISKLILYIFHAIYTTFPVFFHNNFNFCIVSMIFPRKFHAIFQATSILFLLPDEGKTV